MVLAVLPMALGECRISMMIDSLAYFVTPYQSS